MTFMHVYPETHCNNRVSHHPFPQPPESRGKKRKGLFTPVSLLYLILPYHPYHATVPVIVVPDEPVVVRAAIVICSAVAIVVVPAAVVPAAPVVLE